MYGQGFPQAQFQDGMSGMNNNKRKFEGGADTAATQLKKSTFEYSENGSLNQDMIGEGPQAENKATDIVTCPSNLVGKLIGRQGETINIIQAYSNCKVQVSHKEEGDPKKVSIFGTPENILKVKQVIDDVIYKERNIMDEKREIDCPQDIVGKIIGKSGETIKALILNSEAKIHVNQEFPEGVPRKIQISGRLDNVEIAYKMVIDILYGQNQTVQSIVQRYAKTINVKEQCSKAVVGKIIGKNGANIKVLIKKTMAKIQIEQQTDPCIIDITGTEKSVNQALKDLREIIAQLQGGGQFAGQMGQPFQQPYSQPNYNMGGALQQYQQQQVMMGQQQAQTPYSQTYSNYYSNPQSNMGQASAAQYGAAGGYGAASMDTQAYGAMGGAAGGAAAAGQTNGIAGGSDWQELKDNMGRSYYFNRVTNISQWEKPAELM